jgi:hypothetical protein
VDATGAVEVIRNNNASVECLTLTNQATSGAANASFQSFKTFIGSSVTYAAVIGATASTWSYGNSQPNSFIIQGYGSGGVGIRAANAPIIFSNGNADPHFSNERLRITSSGLVGVGTSSPSELLTVGGATANIGIFNSALGSNASPSSSKINFYGYSQTANGNIASISAINTQLNTFGGVLQFATNTALGAHTTALTIDSSQRVGIGITSPATLLDVNGDVTIADKIIHGGDTNTAIRFPAADVFSVETAGSERLRIDSAGVMQIADAGNITVGTTTGTKIGTATTQKLGFYNATPVVQPAAVANATDAASVITQLNDLLAKLRTLGIIAT